MEPRKVGPAGAHHLNHHQKETMTMTPEDKLRDYYDAVAAYGPPPEGELDDLIDRISGGEFGGPGIDRTALRRQVAATTQAIVADRNDGNTGAARQHGPAHVQELRGLLSAAPPERVTDIGAVIDSIPRGL